MAHPSKFVSVNLNKSYGKPANAHPRGGSHPSAGGVGGGMVVLSRPRSSSSSTSSLQKMGQPKLSVPPPLNLPSMRKENEKCEQQSVLGSSARPGSSGIGSGSGSSTGGWTKPSALLPEKESAPPPSGRPVGTAYMLPVARGLPGPSPTGPAIEKAVFLRGEDFPSLKATFTLPSKKEREVSNRKDEGERPEFRSPIHMRPQMRSSMPVSTNAGDVDDRNSVEPSWKQSQTQKKYFPSPLPLVKLTHTSNWADDERDTGLSLPERDRDRGFSRMDFAEVGGLSSKDFYKGDSFGMNKDSWRGPPPSPPQIGFDRDSFRPKPMGASRETNAHFPYGESNGAQDSRYPRRDLGFVTSFRNGKNASTEGFAGRGNENVQSGQSGDPSNNRYRGNSFQSTAASKLPFSAGSKGLSMYDPILNFGRDKRLGASGGKSYLGDAGFNGTDPLSDDPIGIGEANVKMLKRKKEILKHTEFHDPVRASFEAELEKVQRIQEQERQRAMEVQTRVMEIARREHEERERLAREEEERRRLMEEEAREAAWRAEQDRMEAVRRAEEQKIAREEEKRRLFMEEERRKEAARKKFLELEAKIARRQTETQYKDENVTGDEQLTGLVKENEVPKVASDVGDWEDGERMVEHITNTASSESTSTNRYFDTGSSRMQSSWNGSTSFMERGKHGNYGKRDTYDNGSSSLFHLQDQESDFHGSRRDTFSYGRAIPRKDNFGGFVPSSTRPSAKGGAAERSSIPDGPRYSRGNRWNVGGDGNHFNVNLDGDGTDFLDNDKFGDGGWGSGRSHGSPNAPYTERSFQNVVDGGFSSFGRSRHALKQPRVLPPPSISSLRHTSSRNETNSPSTSFPDDQSKYHNAGRSQGEIMQSGYDGVYHQRDQTPRPQEILGSDVIYSEQKEEKDSPRCDSQSSLSVSNPPSSPTHLSHDDFDEADDYLPVQTTVAEDHAFLSESEHVASEIEVGSTNMMAFSSSVSQGDDEWVIENNEELHEQDYDEEDDDYQEEEAAHDGDGGETLEFDHEFDDPLSDLPNKTGKIGQMVLSFNEGVEVSISTDSDLEKTLTNDERGTGIQEELVGDHSLQDDNAYIEGPVSEAAKILNETEKALEELIIDPLPISASNPPDSAEASSVQGMPIQQPVTSGLSSPVVSISTVQPVTSTVDSRVESPIRLQFGLFSGPSLIPSPVPAIQIGSIQMPLHLHPQLGSSITQMHPPEPPFFQFGQLRYPSPLSQGILPLAPETVSFVHPPASAPYSSSQNLGGSLHSRASRVSSSQNSLPDKVPSGPLDKQPALLTKPIDLPQGNINYTQRDELSNSLKGEVASRSQTTRHVSGYQNEHHVAHDVSVRKNYSSVSNSRELHAYPGHLPSTGEKNQTGYRAPGIISSSKGKIFAYSARNAGTRSLFPAPETLQTDSSGFQRRPRRNVWRTEFRVRENVDKRDREALESYNNVSQDGRANLNARGSANLARYGVRKDSISNKLTKTRVESEGVDSGVSSTKLVSSAGKMDKLLGKEALSKKQVSSLENSQLGEVSRKVSISSEEDVGAPLQSGVFCVFKQPGIETPSDEDDFIEVRSKRRMRMLNDRREQREKEIKPKSKVIKTPRKHHAVPQSSVVGFSYKKPGTSFVGDITNTVHSDSVITDGRGFANVEPAPVFTSNISSQTLPPIGTPSARVESDARSKILKSSQTSCVPVTSSGITNFVSGLSFENKSTILANASLPSSSWSNSDINQQVMALTQSQLDDAMKPARFNSQVASSISLEPVKPSTSVMPQEKPFPSSGSPLNSLLAGERIQFGAVTSPTILPPVSRAVSNGIGPPGSLRLDVSKDHSLAATSNECTMFFDKEKHIDESCTHLEDPEAEAAASAVAVAAISNNDEVVANRSGACSVSASKSFSGADSTKLISSGGMTVSKEATSRSVAEESLTVALPADLSVDTPLRLWHPLPSPQSTSGPMLSHFPQPSHFPIVDVNPIFGGTFLAFGPHDESGGTQAQPPRTTTLGSGPIGPWTQCRSGVDSFYGPSTGFAGPYISPSGGIPGVQAPSHMVFYNHFAPVGHLSFMGTAYIPTGKQPDWKHNPVSPATLGVIEGENTNMNVASSQRNPPNMTSTIQHLAPGSPLMPTASPLAMFDMSPFQSSADMPFQPHWSHVPAPHIHSVPLTVPLQQQQQPQVDGMSSQFARNVPVVTSTASSRFNAGDGIRGFSIPNDGATWFPNDLNLVEPPTVSTSSVQTTRPTYNHSKGSNSSKGSSRSAGSNSGESGGSSKIVGSSFKPQGSQQQPTHPRVAYQGRGHSSGSGKSFAPSKMKQIYVPKPPATPPGCK